MQPAQQNLPPRRPEGWEEKPFLLLGQDDLPDSDDMPMDSERHRVQMELLINTLRPHLQKLGEGYVGGDMFIYFDKREQGASYASLGPDVMVVLGASQETRKSWVVWQEGKTPDVVIELLSSSTAERDKTEKKQIYQEKLKVHEYYWFNPFNAEDWAGFELRDGRYQRLLPDAQNRLISGRLNLALVRWHGVYAGDEATWLRWATLRGELLPTAEEDAEQQRRQAAQDRRRAERASQQAKQAHQRAEQERQRADAAEAELARLRELLAKTGAA